MLGYGEDDDPITITEVNGTVARFDMVFEAASGPRHFGIPSRARIPSAIFLAVSLGLVALCLYANYFTDEGALYEFVVVGDRYRALSALKLSSFISICALGTVIRAALQGVTLDDEGLLVKSVVGFGIPRIRRFDWLQIDRLVVTEDDALLELWNGDFERLPAVKDGRALVARLVGIAHERRRTVTVLPVLKRTRTIALTPARS